MRRQALELHRLEPADTDHFSQPARVAAIGFVGPYGQDRLCMARIKAYEWETFGQQCMRKPYRRCTALEANASDVGGVFAYQAGDGLGLRRDFTLKNQRPCLVQHADTCLLERYVQSNKGFHGCSSWQKTKILTNSGRSAAN
jgi:hypothetical protein